MNDIQIFKNNSYGEIRTTIVDGEPMFVAADVCKALELGNPTNAMKRLDEDEQALISIKGISNGNSDINVITESGLYSLVLGSRKPEAKAFKRWITHEVIPAIRKHGAYLTPETIENVMNDPDAWITLLTTLKEERGQRRRLETENAAQKQIIGELQPKAAYVDTILNSKSLVTITQIAKDYGMSGGMMNKLLNKLHIQYKQSGQWLLYAEHHNKGWTHSQTIDIIRSSGYPDVVMETKWTQKGRLALYELLKSHGVLPIIERPATA